MKQFFLILSVCALCNLLASAQTTNEPQIVNQTFQTKKHGSNEATIVKYNSDNSATDIRELEIPGSYQRFQVNGDIRIVLVNEAAGKIVLSGSPKDMNLVKFNFENEEFVVDAARSFSALT